MTATGCDLTDALSGLLEDDPGLTGTQRDFIQSWLDWMNDSEDGAYEEVVTALWEDERLSARREACALLLSFGRCPSSVL